MISGVSSSGLNFSGLASGIDSEKLIEGLTSLNQQRIDTLRSRQGVFSQKQATFAALQGKLFDLQAQANRLARSAGGAFDGRKVTSSDETLLQTTASSAATPGTYSLKVLQLAQAHQISSEAFADPNATIQQGTLQLRVGSGATSTITIDATNNTLQGLADAINAGQTDVRASIVNDGTATPYRLLLTAAKTGAANTISLTNNLNTGPGATINPALTSVQAAGDAQVQLGSGAGALTVNSQTNQVNSLIPGVTLNLTGADANKTVTLNVTADTEAASQTVQDFVKAYNGIAEFIDQRDDYNSETGESGVLLGSREASELRRELEQVLTSSVGGVASSLNRMSSVGITFDDKGRLQLDQGKLNNVLSGKVPGVSFADIKRLFGLTGSSSNAGVSFVFGSDKTQPSGSTPYQVNVSAAAVRGSMTGTNTLAGSIVIDGSNNAFALKVNGVTSTSMTIASGAYTQTEIATTLQTLINGNSSLAGNFVTVDLSASKLRITSHTYGSTSKVEIGAGTALNALGFAGGESGTGADVVGNFVVNGQAETATGSGQALTGSIGNAHTDGLQVRAALASAGSANLTVTQGLGSKLGQILNKYLDPVNGRFKTLDKGFQDNIADIDKTIARQTATMELKKESLLKQFAAMESAVSRLKGLGDQLSAQLGSQSSSK